MKVFEITDPPQLPCEECLKQALGEPGKLEWIYCIHRGIGSIRFASKQLPGIWQTIGPVSFEQWLNILEGYNSGMGKFLAQSKEIDDQLQNILEKMDESKFAKG